MRTKVEQRLILGEAVQGVLDDRWEACDERFGQDLPERTQKIAFEAGVLSVWVDGLARIIRDQDARIRELEAANEALKADLRGDLEDDEVVDYGDHDDYMEDNWG